MTNKIKGTIAILIFCLIYSCNFKNSYEIFVKFNEIDVLYEKDEVRINSKVVGKVSKIILENNQILAKLTINQDQPISDKAIFTIRNSDLLGAKYIDIDNYNGSKLLLSNGDTVKGNLDGKDILSNLDIDTIIQKYAKPILDSLGYDLTSKKENNSNNLKK